MKLKNLQADRIEMLERERGWKEEEFDFVLQFLRTVLLKRMPDFILFFDFTNSNLSQYLVN